MHFTPSSIPDEAEAAIAPAFDHYGFHDAAQWVQRCRDNMAQLWRDGECWAITEVFESKRGQVCHIVALAGTFVQSIMDEIEAWAKQVGCTLVHFTGRKGWERRLPGYETTAIVKEKVIT